MLACLFFLGGFNNVLQWSYVVELLQQKLENAFGSAPPRALVGLALAAAIGAQLPCAVLFTFGIEARLMAQLLLAWLALVTFVMHDFWTVGWADGPPPLAFVLPEQGGRPYPQQRVATFPTNFDNEFGRAPRVEPAAGAPSRARRARACAPPADRHTDRVRGSWCQSTSSRTSA
jgi:uncharacterized membrane protein YphA (DoxX/SURF4 family)